jgi:hypothetical protein
VESVARKSLFNEDGTISLQGPWFEPLFEHSYLFRAFILKVLRYKPGTLLSRSERNRRSDEAVLKICKVLEEQSRIAQKLDARLVVEMMFRRSEIIQKKRPSDTRPFGQRSLRARLLLVTRTAFKVLAQPSERACQVLTVSTRFEIRTR